MKNDIEQRAKELTDELIEKEVGEKELTISQIKTLGSHFHGYRLGYIAGMTEERQRGKRFAKWVSEGYEPDYDYDEVFPIFLSEETELNN